jgi:hypothetical protein
MIKYFILLFISTKALSGNLVEVKQLGMKGGTIYNQHDSYIPEYTTYETSPKEKQNIKKEIWSYRIDLFLDIELNRLGTYFNQVVTGKSTTKQFRYVSWDYTIGQPLVNGIDLYFNHKSEHVFESYKREYPRYDVIGFKFCFAGTCK